MNDMIKDIEPDCTFPLHEELDRCYSRLLMLSAGMQGVGRAIAIGKNEDFFGDSVYIDLAYGAVALGEAIQDVSNTVDDLKRRAERAAK